MHEPTLRKTASPRGSRGKAQALVPDLAIAQTKWNQRRFLRCGAGFGDQRVLRGQRARGVGGGGVAGKVEGLAAAATKIDFPTLAALARLGHPSFASECSEGGGVMPDFVERALLHVVEAEARQGVGQMAGQG